MLWASSESACLYVLCMSQIHTIHFLIMRNKHILWGIQLHRHNFLMLKTGAAEL